MSDRITLWHPFLFSIVFCIMPFTEYGSLIPIIQIVNPLIALFVFALFLFFLIKLIVKKENSAAAILTPLLIIFWNYGMLYEYLSNYTRETRFHKYVFIISAIVTLIIFFIYTVKVMRLTEITIKYLNKCFCIIACTLIIINIFSITARVKNFTKTVETLASPSISNQEYTVPRPESYVLRVLEYSAPSYIKCDFQYFISPLV